MAKRKRTAAQFFDDAETHGLESLIESRINSDKVSKHLQSGTEINYDRMLVLWDEWVLRSLPKFVQPILTASCLGDLGIIDETLVPARTT